MSIYVLHHSDVDGCLAAAAAYGHFRNKAEYIPVNYGKNIPISLDTLTKQDEVYILDFSYPREVLDIVYRKVKKLMVLDHHKTAMEQLKGAPYAIYDLNKCGSTLSWEFFYNGLELPRIFELAEDRDLFRNELPETDIFIDGIWSYNLTNIEMLYSRLLEHDIFLKEILEKGKVLNNKKKKDIKIAFKKSIINGRMLVSNSFLATDLSKYVFDKLDQVDIVLTWSVNDTQLHFELRSRSGSAVDVSKIAKTFGGGGHFHASGFNLNYNDGFKMIAEIYEGGKYF